MKIVDSLLSALFRRKVILSLEVSGLYRVRSYRDGVTLANLTINADFFIGDHNPQVEICFVLFNYIIFNVLMYNRFHIEHQQVIDPSLTCSRFREE